MLIKSRLPLLGALLAFVLFAQAAFAAESVSINVTSLEETAGQIELEVSALGTKGRPLTGMTPDNFKATLGGESLPVREVRPQQESSLPAHVVLVVDTSGSMYGDPIVQARTAIGAFVEALEPDDQISLISFSTEVHHRQGFTSDRGLLDQAIGGLEARGETTLYDAVSAAAAEISTAPEGRRMIVLLSDGVANMSTQNRQASIDAAHASGAGIVAVGLGASVDRAYLGELTSANDGVFLEALTPQALQQAYSDLAVSIRSVYTVVIEVPQSVDRTVDGTLSIRATYDADTATAEVSLGPLPGAVPPPFDLALTGLVSGQSINAPVSLEVKPFESIQLARVEYLVDGVIVHTETEPGGVYEFDPATLALGDHVLSVHATDPRGRIGATEVAFQVTEAVVETSSEGGGLPVVPIVGVAVLGVVAFGVFKLVSRYQRQEPAYVEARVQPWADRIGAGPGSLVDDDSATLARARPVLPEPPVDEAPIGRLVVMHEATVRNGELGGITEYELFHSPLTFGTGAGMDIRVEDDAGVIDAEEARIWVQRGRLVYHKLSTLSAMATEGITPGWQFLGDGEEIRVGAYRLLFQLLEPLPPAPSPLSGRGSQDDQAPSVLAGRGSQGDAVPARALEHGMGLRVLPGAEVSAPGSMAAEGSLGSLGSLEREASAEPLSRRESPYDSSAFEGDRDGEFRSA